MMSRTINPYLRYCFILCVLLLHLFKTNAQEQSIADDLKSQYEADTLTGIKKLSLLGSLAYNESNDFKLSLKYSQELIELAQNLNNQSFLRLGYLYEGNAHYSDENFVAAIQSYQKTIAIAQKIGDKNFEGVVYMSIADTYSSLGEVENAENYYKKSIDILKSPDVLLNKKDSVALGRSYFNAGDEFLKNRKFETSIIFLNEAEKLFRLTQQDGYLPYVVGNKGIFYGEQNLFETAEELLNNAISQLLEAEAYVAASEYQAYLANMYLKQNRVSEAELLASTSLDHAKRLGVMSQISESSLVLSNIYKVKGDYKEAYNYFLDFTAYKDSVSNYEVLLKFNNQQHLFALSQKQAELDLSLKESEIKDLKTMRQRGIIWGITIGLLLISLLAYGLFKRYGYIKRTNTIIEREKERSDKLLLNVLPSDTAKELKQKGMVKAKRFESVTVLFTDFAGFTSYAESMNPEILLQRVDFYFSEFDRIMDKYGLEKIKTIGDAYLCAGGLPFPEPNHAYKIVQAAREILDFMNTVKHEANEDEIVFDIRIGISTGSVIAGVVGTKKFSYDIWGDTVNIASRMESNSEPGKINISEYTYNLIKYDFDCEHRGSINVKNRGKMNMYFVGEPKTT